jgi:hypothetical protein
MGSEWMLGRLVGGWIEFDWLRIGTGCELLWVRWWTFELKFNVLKAIIIVFSFILGFGAILICLSLPTFRRNIRYCLHLPDLKWQAGK